MDFKLSIAKIEDVKSIMCLHNKYHLDSVSEKDKPDGFTTLVLTELKLKKLIKTENSVFIAIVNNELVGFAIAGSWGFWEEDLFMKYIIDNLKDSTYTNQSITEDNSYHYGPVCIEKKYRGQGICEKLNQFALSHMLDSYSFAVGFINKANLRSLEAHTRKAKFNVIKEFVYNESSYYKLVCSTV